MNESETEVKNETETTSKPVNNDNIMAAVAYVFGFVSGIIIYLIEKDKPDKSKYVMFHAVQATILGFVWIVILLIPFIGQLIFIISWVVMIYKAYSGEEYHIPVIGEYADKYV